MTSEEIDQLKTLLEVLSGSDPNRLDIAREWLEAAIKRAEKDRSQPVTIYQEIEVLMPKEEN